MTFVPCFLFIFLGAPYVERLRHNHGLSHALTAVGAAVAGVVLNLAALVRPAHRVRHRHRHRRRTPHPAPPRAGHHQPGIRRDLLGGGRPGVPVQDRHPQSPRHLRRHRRPGRSRQLDLRFHPPSFRPLSFIAVQLPNAYTRAPLRVDQVDGHVEPHAVHHARTRRPRTAKEGPDRSQNDEQTRHSRAIERPFASS